MGAEVVSVISIMLFLRMSQYKKAPGGVPEALRGS